MKRLFLAFLLVILGISSLFIAGPATADGPVNQAVVTRSELSIYAEADANSDVLATVAEGETVDVLVVGELFSQVRYDGVVGYSLSLYLDLQPAYVALLGTTATRSDLALRSAPDITSSVVTTVPRGTTLSVVYVDGIWALVTAGGQAGWTFTRLVRATVPAGNDPGDNVVAQGVANGRRTDVAVRSAPDITASVIGTFRTAPVTVIARSEDGLFTLVASPVGAGWVFTASVAIAPEAIVARGPANLRVGPDKEADQITLLAYETPVTLLGRSSNGVWLYVRVNAEFYYLGAGETGYEGWISASLLDFGDYDPSVLPVAE